MVPTMIRAGLDPSNHRLLTAARGAGSAPASRRLVADAGGVGYGGETESRTRTGHRAVVLAEFGGFSFEQQGKRPMERRKQAIQAGGRPAGRAGLHVHLLNAPDIA